MNETSPPIAQNAAVLIADEGHEQALAAEFGSARGSKPDSPVSALLGLIVIWLCLVLVIQAHRWSDSYIRLKPFQESIGAHHSPLPPTQTLTSPFLMYARDMQAAQAIKNITASVGFTVNTSSLDLMGETAHEQRTVRFDDTPLYQALSELIGSNELAYGLVGRELTVFKQDLTRSAGGVGPVTINWKAQLRLTKEPMLIVPSGMGDYLLSISLVSVASNVKQGDLYHSSVQVEVWKGNDWIAMAKTDLDEKGHGQVALNTADNITLSLQKSPDEKDPVYTVIFYTQSSQ